MSRGRYLLLAQRPGPPLGPPPKWLSAEEARAWHDVVSAAPDVLRSIDGAVMSQIAVYLAEWRSCRGDPGFLRGELYRMLGNCFVPMRERRRLLFPERQRRP